MSINQPISGREVIKRLKKAFNIEQDKIREVVVRARYDDVCEVTVTYLPSDKKDNK